MTKQIHNESFDKQKLIPVLKKHIPHLNDNEITWYDDGWDFIVAVIDAKAFRFPRRKEYECKFPTEVTFVQKFVARSPISIPDLILHKDENIGYFASYTFLPGVPFKSDIAKTFTQENKLIIARKLGQFLTAVHSFPIDEAKEIGIQEENVLQSWTDHFQNIKKMVFPHLNLKQQDWTTRIFASFLQLIKEHPVQTVVTHSDIAPEHIIVNPDEQTLSGVIDFGDINITDPTYDFTFLNKYGKDFLEEAYGAYTLPRDPYFEKRRQFYEDRLVVTNMEHSVKVGEQYWIERHKVELAEYMQRALL
ncbi:MAG: phosphotransferase [Candidatus Roizmanbacteria bacterium]|nr:phosphotransferase [Candidatus Roizmanbacteria bacterium]